MEQIEIKKEEKKMSLPLGEALEQRIDNLCKKYNIKFKYNYKFGTNSNRVHFYFYSEENFNKIRRINNPKIALNKNKPVFFYFRDFKREISDKEFQKRFFEALDRYIIVG